MEITLFRALKSISIDDDIAEKVVEAVEEHIEMAVGQAVKPLENKIDTLKAQIDTLVVQISTLASKIDSVDKGMSTSITALKWWLGSVTGIITIIALGTGMAKDIF